MATEDNLNPNLFGTNNNQEEDEEEEALPEAQDVRIGAGVPALNSNIVAQVPGIQNIRNPGAFDPANMGLNRPIMSAGTAGRDERTTLSEFASQGISSAVEGLRDVVGTESVSMDEYRAAQATQAPSAASTFGATPSVTPPVETPSVGAQEQVQTIQQGAPDSPQANFATRMETGEALSPQEIQDAQSFAASMGTTFDPATGYSREPFKNAQQAQGQVPTAPMPAQTLSQFMRYEDAPGQRTEQFVDAQGRMRFRPTQEALQLQGQGAVAQPPAAALSSFEQDSLSRQQRIGGTGSYEGDSEAREARVRASDRQPGESQADRDTRIAQSRTTGGQTEGLSFDDARRRAEGQLAARGVKNPTPSQVNALARGIQAGEPERLAELETKRAINEARLKTAQATLDRPEFEGNVYTVNGVTFAQTSRGGAQVIDTGTETDKESTKKMKDFEFTSQKIKEAREAYLAGDLTKANDIITAAEIQKDGFATNATEYFKDSITPPASQVTDSGLTQQQESGIQNVMATNGITREDAIKALKEAGKLK